MKKNYLIVMLALVFNFAMAQVQQTSYRGAFAPSPTPMWTAGWTNFDPQNADYRTPTVIIASDITSNTIWTANNVYQLNGLITVRNNATLTIQPGTVIRSAQNASALLITRGAKLIANGTATLPIVFTSNKAIGSRARGDWGGIVMLGRARYNINNGVNFIEGLTQTPITEFGGGLTPDNNDNSGILRFVRIEYAGYVFAPNNELNGLTMGAVGKGTVIENVQVSYSNDDSFEWFGGSVNCKNLVAFAGLDDDFDVDNGFTGIVQFGLAVKDPLAADISTSEIFEVDNNATGADTAPLPENPTAAQTAAAAAIRLWADYTSPIFTNITCIGANQRPNGSGTLGDGFVTPNSLHDKSLRLRRANRINIFNSIFLDSRRGLSLESASTNTAFGSGGTAKFKNNFIASPIPFISDGSTSFTLVSSDNTSLVTSNTGTVVTSSGTLITPYNGTDATNYKLFGEAVTATSTAVGAIDYRPLSGAVTAGASFTDAKLSPLVVLGNAPGVTPALQYCKGVVAPALTANFTPTGVSLRWYAKPITFKVVTVVGAKDVLVTNPDLTQTITVNGEPDILAQVVDSPILVNAVPATNNLVPATTTPGLKSYFVAEVDALGVESQRSRINVTTVASPLLALGTIAAGPVDSGTGLAPAATTVVSTLIGTTTTVTYVVPASTEEGVTGYLWTVPAGANIVSQGAGVAGNSIVVNYLNVPAGILKVGNITVRALNAASCGGAIKTLAITAALPKAPAALVMNDGSTKTNATTGVTSLVAITSFAKYMGTNTSLTLTATPVVGAQSYVWELPEGVNLLNLGTVDGTPSNLFYGLFPFITPISRPTTVGNQYFLVTTTTYTSGAKIATASRYVVGGKLANNALVAPVGGFMATSLTDATPTTLQDGSVGVFRANVVGASFTEVNGVTPNPAYPITSTTSNVINVNFAGVTFANSNNYFTAATVPVSTNIIRIGVKSVHGVGASVTANAATVLPIPPLAASTAKLLTLKAVRPAAPAAIKMTDGVSATAITNISRFVGTNTVFTLTATPSVLASSYSWELPASVNLVSDPASLSTNVISVNFANVPAATTAVYIGVKAVNGISSSVTVNLAPNAGSTAKLLKLTAAVPAAVTVVAGQIAGVCGGSSYNYTITPTLATTATSYDITAPTGSVVTSASIPSNSLETLNTSDLTFTVTYPAGFASTTAVGVGVKTLTVAARNGVGTSLNKTLALSTLMPALGIATPTSYTRATPVVVTVPTVVGAVSYTWTVALPAVITSGEGTNSVTVDFSGVLATATSYKLTVIATNACGISTAVKSITLSNAAPGARIRQVVEVTATEVYPNPVSSEFSIDVTASTAGALEISIYSLDGTLVVSPKSVQLQEGANTINENISSLRSGIYILQLVNSSNGEVITKKLIKE